MTSEGPEQNPRQPGRNERQDACRTPGSMVIRPTRRDAEQDADAFYALLDWSRKKEQLTLARLASILGTESGSREQYVSKKISERKISPEKQRDIIRNIFVEKSENLTKTRQRIQNEPDVLYFALLNYLQVNETSQDNARAAIEGTFQFWRRSVEHPSEFLHGKLVFSEDPNTRAVKVTMEQAKRPREGFRATRSEADGYFFRVGKHYLMLLQDRANREFRFTYFPGVRFAEVGTGAEELGPDAANSIFAGRQRHITSLDGYVIGIDYNRCFLSPIYATLVDDVDQLAKLDGMLDVMPADDKALPARVKAKLDAGGPLQILS